MYCKTVYVDGLTYNKLIFQFFKELFAVFFQPYSRVGHLNRFCNAIIHGLTEGLALNKIKILKVLRQCMSIVNSQGLTEY